MLWSTLRIKVLASLGVAAANLTFVGATIVDILQIDYNLPAPGHVKNGVDPLWSNSAWIFTVGALVLVTPLTWLRSFKILAYAAVLGNVCLLAGVIGVIGFGYSQVYANLLLYTSLNRWLCGQVFHTILSRKQRPHFLKDPADSCCARNPTL